MEPTGMRVLVVEDDPDTLATLGDALRGEFAVWVARTGARIVGRKPYLQREGPR